MNLERQHTFIVVYLPSSNHEWPGHLVQIWIILRCIARLAGKSPNCLELSTLAINGLIKSNTSLSKHIVSGLTKSNTSLSKRSNTIVIEHSEQDPTLHAGRGGH